MNISLNYWFHLIEITPSPYILLCGHHINRRNPKYKIYRSWYNQQKLYCFSCLKEATHFKIKKCKENELIDKKSGQQKYFVALYADDDTMFTLDHWFPKWFLKRYNYIQSNKNLVPMCISCNEEKANTIPTFGRYNKSVYVPILRQHYNNMPFIHKLMVKGKTNGQTI